METVAQIQRLLLRSRRLPWLVTGLALAILAGTILLARQQLRGKIREQIISRDGAVLHAVVVMQIQQYQDEAEADLLGPIEEPASQLTVLLKTARLKGVLALRLFDVQGRFVEAFPLHVHEANLNPLDRAAMTRLPVHAREQGSSSLDPAALKKFRPVSHFHDAVRLAEIFWPLGTEKGNLDQNVPLLEVNVPLQASEGAPLIGFAQFILEGESIAAEFALLDRRLTLQALAAFGTGGALLLIAVGLAFRRLRQAHRLLEERTSNLLQANQELALAAKTSAVGAVTSHLIHGLKNPLSGLRNFVSNLGQSEAERTGADWQEAIATTQRMQAMINQVVGVLREEGPSQYEITLAELAEIITARAAPLAREAGVRFSTDLKAEAVLSNRAANLVTLILINLVQNALQATPAGGAVRLRFGREEDQLVCQVQDEGPGLPEIVKQNLFAPCQSLKAGGAGIGLAISKQLANHLGAGLALKSNSANGCVFALSLPPALWALTPSTGRTGSTNP